MARMAHCANIHSGFVLLQARVRGARARKIVHVRAEILSRMMQYAKLPEEHWSGEDCTTNQYHRHELNITLTCMLHLFCSKQEFVVCKKYHMRHCLGAEKKLQTFPTFPTSEVFFLHISMQVV
jgi:hypothetical protein